MAHAAKFSDAWVSAAGAAGLALLDNGYLDIYDGAKPADPSVAVTTQTRLARLRFALPAFPYPVAGVSTSFALTSDTATVGGTATWFRALKADLTAQADGTVGLADADLVLNTVTILTNGTLDIPSITYTQAKG